MSVSTKMDEQTNIAMAKTKIRLERKKNNMYNSLQQKYIFTKLSVLQTLRFILQPLEGSRPTGWEPQSQSCGLWKLNIPEIFLPRTQVLC